MCKCDLISFCFQTHISENLGEIAAVHEVHPDAKNYADVYDQAGLLTNKVEFKFFINYNSIILT